MGIAFDGGRESDFNNDAATGIAAAAIQKNCVNQLAYDMQLRRQSRGIGMADYFIGYDRDGI
ncbi:hypothetical protein GCM10023184_03980 [Flaviaesturariibacter amylovorans]|uniref:Uncharacterized protein n=1 Tax=Flaviaesturariibacter amylovorans TaxID=1084520 RepID=A0ABP8G830_9BACT